MELFTPRLQLRPWRRDDLVHLQALNAEPEVHNWLGGPSLLAHSGEALQLILDRFDEWG